jgi:hypothetical protein
MKRSLLLLLMVLLVSILQRAVLAQGVSQATPPPYCHPCLFYGGDLGSGANGLANEKDILVPDGAEVLVPFDVPASQQWTVTGLFTNDLSNVGLLDPPKALWSMRKGVRTGNCGTVVASGSRAATFKPTGRGGNGFDEYTALTKIKAVVLPPGRYWLTAVPECTNGQDSNCGQARYFASSFSGKPKHAYGPKEPCASFFNSPISGTNCQPVFEKNHCGGFSAGVLGTK